MSELYGLAAPDVSGVWVEVLEGEQNGCPPGFVNVVKVMGSSEKFGENFLFPIPRGLAYVPKDKLDIESKGLAGGVSFFGKLSMTVRYQKRDIEVVVAEYSNCETVTVIDISSSIKRTVYSQNFFDKRYTIRKIIEDELTLRDSFDDLVFTLQKAKQVELGFTGEK